MLSIKSIIVLLLVLLSLGLGGAISAGSRDNPRSEHDDDSSESDHEYEEAYQEKEGKSRWFVFRRVDVKPVSDPLYLKECGACHFAYQPGLLPSKSWEKIMAGLDDHFGDNATLDIETAAKLTAFLNENAAEYCECRKSYKILRSLRGETPTRITEVPYIKREHREVSARSLSKLKLKSFANCEVCHRDASGGLYDDD